MSKEDCTGKILLGIGIAWVFPLIALILTRKTHKRREEAIEPLPYSSPVSELPYAELTEELKMDAHLMTFYRKWSDEKNSLLKIYTHIEKLNQSYQWTDLTKWVDEWFENNDMPCLDIEVLTTLLINFSKNEKLHETIFSFPPMLILTGMTDYNLFAPKNLKELGITADLLGIDRQTIAPIKDFMMFVQEDYQDAITNAKRILKEAKIAPEETIIPFSIFIQRLKERLSPKTQIQKSSQNKIVQHFYAFLKLFKETKNLKDKYIPKAMTLHMLFETRPEEYTRNMGDVYLVASYITVLLNEINIKTIIKIDVSRRTKTIERFLKLLKAQKIDFITRDSRVYFSRYFLLFDDMLAQTRDFMSITQKATTLTDHFFPDVEMAYPIYYVKVLKDIYTLAKGAYHKTEGAFDARFDEMFKELSKNFHTPIESDHKAILARLEVLCAVLYNKNFPKF